MLQISKNFHWNSLKNRYELLF